MPFAAHAGSEFVEGDATLAGEAELGATLTTGNTDTSSFKARLALKQELGDWENEYVFEGLYKEDTEEVTAKRYFLGVQGDYQINDVSYLFANTNYEVDPFTGYDFTSTTSAGYGHRFIDTDRMSLKAEAGPGYIYQQLDEESALAEGYDSDDSVVAHAVIDFQTKISDSSKFQQKFVADWGSKLDARSETSLTANIVGALAMKFAVIVRYNSEPLDDKESTDTETNMTLLYAF
jgi:putative salt-induced outer membrane protein YdiY